MIRIIHELDRTETFTLLYGLCVMNACVYVQTDSDLDIDFSLLCSFAILFDLSNYQSYLISIITIFTKGSEKVEKL